MVFQGIRKRIGLSALAVGLALSLFGLTACRSDHVIVDPKDPDAPKYAYRLDELALLQMAADDIMELERKKDYGTIYDNFASDGFKQGVSRRQFLIMANCVETNLGGLQEYNSNELSFRREYVRQGTQQQSLDVLNRHVQRILGRVEEQLVFVANGLNFKLNGLYWIAKDKQFLQCIADSAALERATAPKPEAPASTGETTATTQTATQTPTTPEAAENGQSAEPNAAPATVSGAENAPAAGESESGAPVQTMKPSEERKKEPLQARPAGAGAVVDTRPTPPKPKKEAKKPAASAPASDHAEPSLKPPTPMQDTTPPTPSSEPPTPDASH